MKDSKMIVLNVFMTVKKELYDEFKSYMSKLISQSTKDAGCEHYVLYENSDNQYSFVLIEHWADETSLEAHNKTQHLIEFLQLAPKYVVKPVEILKYNV